MQSIDDFKKLRESGIRGVLTDIDGTLTNDGQLGAEAYVALWRLKEAGLRVVPVTGRPAGWCDMIVRQWPVDGVIGENGALVFYPKKGKVQRLFHPSVRQTGTDSRLDDIRKEVLAAIPGSRVSKDQAYRLFDLAIDFREEEPDLGFDAARKIRDIFVEAGARAKISDIHVNGWFGDYDKLSMAKIFVEEVWGEDSETLRDHYAYCGDSPNDEPMFEFFKYSFAPENIRLFEDELKHEPGFVADGEGGTGFARIAEAILTK